MKVFIYNTIPCKVRFQQFPPICQGDSGASWNKTIFVFLARCLPLFVTCCSWLRGPCFLLLSLSRTADQCLQQRRACHCTRVCPPPCGHLMWQQWCSHCSGGQWPEGARLHRDVKVVYQNEKMFFTGNIRNFFENLENPPQENRVVFF